MALVSRYIGSDERPIEEDERVSSLLKNGLTFLFRGARRGQSPLSALGAAMAILGWMRSRRGADKELVYSRNLRNGEQVTVKLVRGGAVVDEQRVEG